MEPENFGKSPRRFRKRRPFLPFVAWLQDGTSVTVDHPEARIVRGGIAVYSSSSGDPTLFDHRSVGSLSGLVEAPAP